MPVDHPEVRKFSGLRGPILSHPVGINGVAARRTDLVRTQSKTFLEARCSASSSPWRALTAYGGSVTAQALSR